MCTMSFCFHPPLFRGKAFCLLGSVVGSGCHCLGCGCLYGECFRLSESGMLFRLCYSSKETLLLLLSGRG